MTFALIFYERIADKEKPHAFDKRKTEVVETELNLDINTTNNPSYNSTKQHRNQEDQYDYVSTLDNKIALRDIVQDIMKDFIPTFGRIQGSEAATYDDVLVQSSLLHSVGTSAIETVEVYESKDEDAYVETNSPNAQPACYLKIFGPTTKEENSL